MKTINVILLAGIILFTACKSKEDAVEPEETETSTAKSASFKIGGTSYSVSSPKLGIFNDNGSIKNNLKLTATDGSIVEFNFTGNTPATYQLASYSNAYYKNAAGKQYNSTSGQLVVSAYTTSGSTYKMSGNFNFWAKAIATPYDSLHIVDGVVTNASN